MRYKIILFLCPFFTGFVTWNPCQETTTKEVWSVAPNPWYKNLLGDTPTRPVYSIEDFNKGDIVARAPVGKPCYEDARPPEIVDGVIVQQKGSSQWRIWREDGRPDGDKIGEVYCAGDIIFTTPPPRWDVLRITPADSGIVIAKANEFDNNTPGSTHTWIDAGSNNAMEVTPNTGRNYSTAIENSPRLDYRRTFLEAGTYYVWVRGWGATNGDDSVHVGINGTPQAWAVSYFNAGGSWSNKQMDGTQAVLTVPSAGEHTLNIWMREDGFIFDLLLLSTDPAYVP